MKYLLWRAKVKAYLEETYDSIEGWESWVTWREYFLDHKSPSLAASEAYTLHNS
jgi:hypothetical protein